MRLIVAGLAAVVAVGSIAGGDGSSGPIQTAQHWGISATDEDRVTARTKAGRIRVAFFYPCSQQPTVRIGRANAIRRPQSRRPA